MSVVMRGEFADDFMLYKVAYLVSRYSWLVYPCGLNKKRIPCNATDMCRAQDPRQVFCQRRRAV